MGLDGAAEIGPDAHQGSARRVEHPRSRHGSKPPPDTGFHEKAGAGQSLLRPAHEYGGRRHTRRPSCRIASMRAGLRKATLRSSSPSQSGRASIRMPVSSRASNAIPAMSREAARRSPTDPFSTTARSASLSSVCAPPAPGSRRGSPRGSGSVPRYAEGRHGRPARPRGRESAAFERGRARRVFAPSRPSIWAAFPGVESAPPRTGHEKARPEHPGAGFFRSGMPAGSREAKFPKNHSAAAGAFFSALPALSARSLRSTIRADLPRRSRR